MASTHVASAVLLALLLAVPFFWGSFTAYHLGLLLLYGIVAQGIALCWGRAGFLPLGQALFFGLGAYRVMVLDRGRCVFRADNRPGVRDAVLRHLEL